MNKPSILTAFVAALCAFTLTSANGSTTGQSISVNFGAGDGQTTNPTALAPSDLAGVAQSVNWNNAFGANGTLSDLTVDIMGTAQTVGATVTWNSSNTWSTDAENNTSQFTGADEILMSGYLDFAVGGAGAITFAGLQNGLYDVYVYSLTAVDGRDSGNIVVDGIQKKSITTASSTFIEGGGPGGPDNVGGVPGNYNFYPNVNVTGGALEISMPAQTFRTAVNGV